MDDEVEVFGRRLRLRIEGPDADRRFRAVIDDLDSGRTLTRAPVRGRSAADARDRALEVAHNLVLIERLQDIILGVAHDLAPGGVVELTEDARGIGAALSGAWELAVPLIIERADVYDPEFDLPAAEEKIRRHFAAHLRRAGD
jgi:hypothetical protein